MLRVSIALLAVLALTATSAGAAGSGRAARPTLAVSPASPVAGKTATATVVSNVRGRHVLRVARGSTRRSVTMKLVRKGRLRAPVVFASAGRWTARVTVGKRELVRRAVVVRAPSGGDGEAPDPRFQEWNVTRSSRPHDVAPAPDGT